MQVEHFFSNEEKKKIREVIQKAEHNTSGEIRIHIEASFHGSVLDRAATVFSKLGMQKTHLRNGVLFYLAIKNKQFAILGDAGINQVVPDNFWEKIKEMMEAHFRNSEFVDGLCKGIEMTGQQLKTHFPYQAGDKNELPDEISFNHPE